MSRRILISGGGTGGGTYPAIAVANALRQRHPETDILWIGSKGGIEAGLVERAGLDFRGVAGGPIVGVGLRAIPSAIKLGIGTLAALGHVRRFRPQALMMTGGWPSLPATLACWLLRVPILIYLPDLEPGSTIKVTSRLADRVAAHFEASADYFPPGMTVTTGYPLRAEVLHAAGFHPSGEPLPDPPDARAAAQKRFGLEPGLPTLLVFGGSKGTGSINEALLAGLPAIVRQAQVLHITGREHWEAVQREAASLTATALSGSIPTAEEKQFGRTTVELEAPITSRYHPHAYLQSDDMALALAAADLVVSRSGAATLAEFPLFGLPAILVPLAKAWRYQQVNAEFLAERGAAIIVPDEALPERLVPEVTALLSDAERRTRMGEASTRLRRPDAASKIVDALLTTGQTA